MEAFTIEIAGLAARVEPLFESTMEYCRPYLSRKAPELQILVSPEDLVYEQAMAEREAVETGLKIRKFKDPFLERAAIQRKIADALLDRDTLLLHGSTVAVDGAAYLFTAPCGTGKSTHTRLWRELFGDRAVMVNDDKPFLHISGSGVLAYGSPWSGKHGLHSNICVPLKGICLLRRGSENRIEPVGPDRFWQTLCAQANIPEEDCLREKALSLARQLAEKVPLWEMACTRDVQAAQVSYDAMSGI